MIQKVRFFIFCFVFVSVYGAHAQPGSVSLATSTGTSLGFFNSLSAAYAAIPTPLVGSVIIEMLPSYTAADEVLPLTFTERLGASSTNTITIRPAASVTSIVHTASITTNAVIYLDGADGLILDGRPGGQGTLRVWTVKNLGTSGNVVQMRNGATYNQVRFLILENSTPGTIGSCLLLGTSPSQAQGNSFNQVEHNVMIGSGHGVTVSGTPANRNVANSIRQNEIFNFAFAGIWLQTGTGSVSVDSNVIYGTFPLNTGPTGIFVSGDTDTVLITRNHIFNINGGNFPVQLRGIWIISSTTNPAANYTYIANNFIAITLPNNGSPRIMGVEYSGSGSINTRLYNNTILIGGAVSLPPSSSLPLSAAVSKIIGANTASNYDIRNNLFLNTRTGGFSDAQHVAIWLNNTIGINELNNNTYSSSLQLARIGDTVYTSFPAYVASLQAGFENEGNTRQVLTVSNTNLQLTGNSLGDSLLGAPAISGINTDLLGNPRHPVRVYRGAHEASPSLGSCAAAPNIGTAAVNNSNVCAGDSITLSLSLPLDVNKLYQWQRSTAGGPFININGANTTPFRLVAIASSSYRCVAVCINGGVADTSNVLTVNVVPAIDGLGISSNAAGFTYTFSADSAIAASQFQWNFDDGNTATGRMVSHTFSAIRQYNVRVVASNSCFSDSTSLLVTINGLSTVEHQMPKLRIWPNPALDQISVDADFDVRQIQLISISGVVIRRWEVSGERNHSLPLADLFPGIYFMRVFGSNGETITKAIQRMP